MLLNFLIMFIAILYLLRDGKQDPTLYKRAKIVNGIVITLLLGYLATAYRLLGWVLKHFQNAEEKFNASIGPIPANLNWSIFWVQLGMSLLTSYVVSMMLKRSLSAKNFFLKLLPVLALSESFTFYRSWTMYGQELEHQWVGALLGLLVFGGIATIIMWLYSKPFIKAYYASEPVKVNVSN